MGDREEELRLLGEYDVVDMRSGIRNVGAPGGSVGWDPLMGPDIPFAAASSSSLPSSASSSSSLLSSSSVDSLASPYVPPSDSDTPPYVPPSDSDVPAAPAMTKFQMQMSGMWNQQVDQGTWLVCVPVIVCVHVSSF